MAKKFRNEWQMSQNKRFIIKQDTLLQKIEDKSGYCTGCHFCTGPISCSFPVDPIDPEWECKNTIWKVVV